MDYYELIPSYLNNTLSADQRIAFEKEMSRDEELRITVEEFPLIQETINASVQHDARTLIATIRREQHNKNRQTPGRFIFRKRWSIAAMILVLVAAGGLLILNINYSTPALTVAAYETPSDLGVFQSGGSSSEWEEVMNAWKNGDRTEALSLAEKFLSLHPKDVDVIRRSAYLFFETGRYDRSAELLRSIRDDRQYGDYADFHYALSLSASGNSREANLVLDSIITIPGHRYGDKAKEFRKQLRGLWHRLAFH